VNAGALLVAVALLAPTPRAAPVSLHTYIARVHLARVSLDRAMQNSADRADVDRAARLLRGLATVQVPGGRVLRTDSPARASRLFPITSDSTRHVAAWLDALDDTLQRTQPITVPASDLHQLDTVLRDARFHPVQWPWDRLDQWLVSLYRTLLRDLSQALRPGRPTSVIPAAVLLLMVVAIGYLIARGAMGKLVVERSADDEYASPTTPVAAHRHAGDLAAAGNYREALRYLFLSTMLELQAHGLIELRPGMTNREYLRALIATGSMPEPVAAPLAGLVDTFDRVWYGHQPIDEAGYRRAETAAGDTLGILKGRVA
jgi:hypothetical protein